MVATTKEIDEMEFFFRGQELPETFNINPATRVNNLPAFVKQIIELLREPDVRDVIARPRWQDLIDIRKQLEK